MSLFQRILAMFSREKLPDETRSLFDSARDIDALREGLDRIATENEVQAREIEREIEKFAEREAAQKSRLTGAETPLPEHQKLSILREIERLRRRMQSLAKRHKIHQDNIDLHLGLFDRISEMQAMELKQVTQTQIEEIAVDYDEKRETHRDVMHAARVAEAIDDYEDTAERRRLEALEREILAEAGKLELPAKEPKEPAAKEPKEPAAKEPAAKEPAAKEPAPVAKTQESQAEEAGEGEGEDETVDVKRPARRSLDQELAELEDGRRQEDRGRERTLEVE